ncbi:MAG: hypothetical protein IPK26_23540 [Planctomycetes bacterium]|nr:hypothetical protein [Planctomycetota bacterium]
MNAIAVRIAVSLVAGTVACLSAAAQITPPPSAPGQQPSGSGLPAGQRPPDDAHLRDPLRSQWTLPADPALQGFPLFPSTLPGYGQYPRTGQAPPAGGLAQLPPAPPATGWPGWLIAGLGGKVDDGTYKPDRAVLIRHADRVWFKSPDEEAFVPLYHWDQTRVLPPQSEIEVRHIGEFQLLLHGGGRLVTVGPTRVRIAAMTDERVRLEIPTFTRLRLSATGRTHEIVLPDGSTLVIPEDAEGALAQSAADLLLLRADEPGWIAGRATIFHAGGRQVLWQSRFGDVLLDPGRQVTFFLTPPAATHGAALVTDGIAQVRDGAALRCTAERDGASVVWSGAKFTLPAGSNVHLDPLLGTPFAPTGN